MPPETGYETVFVTHHAALVKSVTSIVGSRSRAEDVVQEGFVKFIEAVRAGEVRHPVAFLFRTVRNLAVDRWRRLRLEVRTGAGEEIPETVQSLVTSPEDTVMQRDELRTVAAALCELPAPCRRAFALHRVGGYTHEEIAQRLGVSPSMIDKYIRQALTHCRARLREVTRKTGG